MTLNPIALRMAKTLKSFGHSGSNRVKMGINMQRFLQYCSGHLCNTPQPRYNTVGGSQTTNRVS